jgi:hypothetical protein
MAADPDVLTMAIAQVEQGFAAFALAANGKRPVTAQGFKNATTNPDWIRKQLEAPSAGNYGITWPEASSDVVLALDLDNGSDGRERPWQERLRELITTIGPLPSTKATTTPSGGRHAFYRWPQGVPVPQGDELFGFTVRWPGRGYLVGPGSSIDGVVYQPGPVDEILELPTAWVEAAIAERQPRRSGGVGVTIAGGYVLPDVIPSGRRYATVRDYVASRYNSGLGPDELWDLVRSQVAPRFTQPKSDEELRADFDRVMAKITERLGAPRRAGFEQPAIPAGPLELQALTEFSSEPVEWLWGSWLPRGVVTLMDGNPGVSKSTLVADLVARITTAREWPDGSAPASRDPGRVVWITTEDDPGRVLRPRVEAARGDASRVLYVTSEVVFPSGAGAFRELVVQVAAQPEGLALVVLDPLFSHLEASIRTIADSEMRRGVMNPLQDTADAAGIAILVVRHFSKDTTASAVNRGAGSLGGIVGSARAVWTVTVDKSDETGETKAIGVSKLNYARATKPLLYSVVDKIPPGWVTGSVSGINWRGRSRLTIDELLTESPKAKKAAQVLRELLEDRGGTMSSVDAIAALQASGYGRTAINTAKSELGIHARKLGMSHGWQWSLPSPEESEESRGDSSKVPKKHGGDSSDEAFARAGAGAGRTALDDSSDSSGEGRFFEESEESEESPPAGSSRAPAREADAPDDSPVVVTTSEARWIAPCLWYADHTSKHRQTPEGWTCDACHPPEDLPA